MNAEIATPDGEMGAYVAKPDSRPEKAIIVIQEAFGVNSHIREVCDRFSKNGFLAVAPELFHRAGKNLTFPYDDFSIILPIFSKLTNETITTDIEATINYLKETFELNSRSIAAIGFCVGGFAAMLAACRTDVSTVIAYYGGAIVHKRPNLMLSPIIEEFHRIRVPVQLFFGEQDDAIPQSDVQEIKKALEKNHIRHELSVYSSAGHGFFCPDRASYNAKAAEDAWRKTLTWLKRSGS